MQLFFDPNITAEANSRIEGQEHIHLSKSLRKTIGDQIHVTDGKGNLFLMEITLQSKKYTEVKYISKECTIANPVIFTLAVAPTKNISRYEWMIEKSVEMHVLSFMPFTSFHSERRNIKLERLEQLAIGAMKQSLQFHQPEIKPLRTFKDLMKQSENYKQKYIAYCEESDREILKKMETSLPTIILVGPEGGFSEEEIRLSEKHGFVPISLGKSRLRTETAAIFAASMYFSKL